MKGEICRRFLRGIEFGHRILLLVRGVQPVVVALAKGIVDLGHHLPEISPSVVKIEKRNGIEHVSKVAEMGEKKDRSIRQGDAFRSSGQRETFADRFRGVADMVLFKVREPIPAVVRGEARRAQKLRQAVHVQERQEDRVGERMMLRREAPMPQGSGVERGFHDQARIPSAAATLKAEFTPSSWNP